MSQSTAQLRQLVETRTRELQESEERFRLLTENLPVGVYRTGRNGEIWFANRALLKMFGYDSLEELQQATVFSLFVDPAQRTQQLEQLKSQQGIMEQEINLQRKDGTPIRVRDRGQVTLDAYGEIAWIDGILEDITERKRTEQALQESEEKYRQLFTTKLEAISIFDGETGRILDVNHAWEELYGYTIEEVLRDGMAVTDVSSEPDKTAAAVQQSMAEAHATRIPIRWHKDRSGRVFPVEIYAGTFEWKGRRVMCAAMRDISERQQAEQQRLELALEKERVQILANFITQTSHEFRTPLSVIATSCYLLSKTDDPALREHNLQKIQHEVDNINHLVSSMLLMSKFDSERPAITRKTLNLNHILRTVSEAMAVIAARHGLALVEQLAPRPLLIRGDVEYLEQAVIHILQNAIQHTPSGGSIAVCSRIAGHQAVVEMTDTGAGISENDLPRIFEQFYRGENSQSSRGFGLGLTIVKRVAEIHGGTVEIERQPGAGTTVRLALPLAEVEAAGNRSNVGTAQ